MLRKKTILVLPAFVIFLFLFFGVSVEYKFYKKQFSNPIANKPQLWSHRGVGELCPENSICAFEQAIAKGAQGMEVDVFFKSDITSFIVTHDPPQPSTTYPELEDYFKRFRDSTFYWIDLKNITTDNATAIAETMSQLSKKYKLEDKLFIESSNAALLYKLSEKKIKTLYWLQFNRSNTFIQKAKLLLIKYLLVKYDFSGVSTSAFFFDDEFKKAFPKLPVFIFHPKDSTEINLLRRDPNVNVILTDSYFRNQDENN